MDRSTFESSFVESLDIRPPNWWVEPPLRNLMRQFARAYRPLASSLNTLLAVGVS